MLYLLAGAGPGSVRRRGGDRGNACPQVTADHARKSKECSSRGSRGHSRFAPRNARKTPLGRGRGGEGWGPVRKKVRQIATCDICASGEWRASRLRNPPRDTPPLLVGWSALSCASAPPLALPLPLTHCVARSPPRRLSQCKEPSRARDPGARSAAMAGHHPADGPVQKAWTDIGEFPWGAREFLRFVQEAMPCGVVLLDARDVIRLVNPVMLEILGQEAGELLRRRFPDDVRASGLAAFFEFFDQARRGMRPVNTGRLVWTARGQGHPADRLPGPLLHGTDLPGHDPHRRRHHRGGEGRGGRIGLAGSSRRARSPALRFRPGAHPLPNPPRAAAGPFGCAEGTLLPEALRAPARGVRQRPAPEREIVCGTARSWWPWRPSRNGAGPRLRAGHHAPEARRGAPAGQRTRLASALTRLLHGRTWRPGCATPPPSSWPCGGIPTPARCWAVLHQLLGEPPDRGQRGGRDPEAGRLVRDSWPGATTDPCSGPGPGQPGREPEGRPGHVGSVVDITAQQGPGRIAGSEARSGPS